MSNSDKIISSDYFPNDSTADNSELLSSAKNINEITAEQQLAIFKELTKEQLLEIDQEMEDLPLSRIQRMVVNHWFTKKTISQIAYTCGITPNCISKWMKHDKYFQRAIKLKERQNTYAAKNLVKSFADDAARMLGEKVKKGDMRAIVEVLKVTGVITPDVVQNTQNNTQNNIQINVNLSAHTSSDEKQSSEKVSDDSLMDNELIDNDAELIDAELIDDSLIDADGF